MSVHSVLRFGVFELDAAAGELRRRGHKVKLAPQPFRLLVLLASSPGTVLTRQKIRKELWNETFVDFEQGLNFCIREVRKALCDNATRPRFVETLPRRGYRFVAQVICTERSGASVPGQQSPSQSSNPEAQYAKGRQLFRLMETGSLELAAKHFQQALQGDPDYAMAHSGLGAACAMQYIREADAEHLRLARKHLERACALDRELAEPHPWLCYVYMRYGDLEAAIETGRRAVKLLPDLVQAHYFLGLAYFLSCEAGAQNYEVAVHHLLKAAKVGPRWPATWFVLASICLLNNEYGTAEDFAHRLLECNALENTTAKFIGSENLLGTLYLRRGDLATARQWYLRSVETLAASDHTYAEAMKAWSACGLGDVALREDRPDAALVHYRKAWQLVHESPTMMGNERHASRALAGLASAYAAAHQPDHARDVVAQATPLLQKSEAVQTSAAGANLAELHYAFAVASLRIGDRERSLRHLEHAYSAGWRDPDWLERDSELRDLQSHPTLIALVQKIRRLHSGFGMTLARVI
jgi:DNA-binding winged helix-turn-helix (wHTH) protein